MTSGIYTPAENDVTAQPQGLSPIGSADVELMKFLRAIAAQGSSASRSHLPFNDRKQDQARQKARRAGLALYLNARWHLTNAGHLFLQRAALAEEASSEGVTSESDTPAEAAP